MTKELKLKPGWLKRDIAKAREQIAKWRRRYRTTVAIDD